MAKVFKKEKKTALIDECRNLYCKNPVNMNEAKNTINRYWCNECIKTIQKESNNV